VPELFDEIIATIEKALKGYYEITDGVPDRAWMPLDLQVKFDKSFNGVIDSGSNLIKHLKTMNGFSQNIKEAKESSRVE